MVTINPTKSSCAEGCASREILDLVAEKWTMLIMYYLATGTMRNAELLRTIGGISQKVLAQQLRKLERNGIVIRKSFPVIPPHVEYSLTPLGVTLAKAVDSITTWSENNYKTVLTAQKKYDASTAVKSKTA